MARGELSRALKERARTGALAARRSLESLSHRIHAHPEEGFQEERAVAWLTEALGVAGLAVEAPVGGLSTAFRARAGQGPLQIAVCAEYDCLPEIGHACGHNVIAATAVGVAHALAGLADDLGLTLWIVGTPAEELGNGKAILLERGVFDGIHAAMMVHPAPVDVVEPPLLAFAQLDVLYADPAPSTVLRPDAGSVAADAMNVAQVAIGHLRQHLRPTDRVHGIVTGNPEPWNAQARVEARYIVRAGTRAELDEVYGKALRCFEAGGLATGARVAVAEAHEAYSEMRHDSVMAALYARNATALGRAFPDLGDLLARGAGSTDMGNVSQVLPSIHPAIGIDSLPYGNHQPEFAAHCVTPAADQAVIDGAIALAWTIIDLAQDPAARQRLISRAGRAGGGS